MAMNLNPWQRTIQEAAVEFSGYFGPIHQALIDFVVPVVLGLLVQLESPVEVE